MSLAYIINEMIIRDTFLLALLHFSASAIKLAVEEEELLPSQTEGPSGGFSDELCEGDAPETYYDPVCYEGSWIEFAWLNDPTFWTCGKKPDDLVYAICDTATGQWTEMDVFDSLEDATVCGQMPTGSDYVVCNHESGEW